MKNKTKRIIRTAFLSIAGLILVALIAAGLVLYGRIASMMSIRHIDGDLYRMNYRQNYHLDKALAAGISTEEELLSFVCDDMFFGYQVDGNFSKYGCAAFSSAAPGGGYMTGRNFDLYDSDALCLYTHPKDGYASISTVSTDMLSIGKGGDYAVTSLYGRAALLAAPYIGVDGMNEKGLTASLLDTDHHGETHMNNEKPDIIVTMAVRMLLDRAATVDEAIELLEQYDINTAHGWTQHIFITDANGDAAVVEFYKREMKVLRYPVCTNFTMSARSLKGNYSGQCGRFDILDNALKEKPENTAEDSMKLLESAKQESHNQDVSTVWSVVFHQNDFSADYAVSMDYDNVYHIDPKDF